MHLRRDKRLWGRRKERKMENKRIISFDVLLLLLPRTGELCSVRKQCKLVAHNKKESARRRNRGRQRGSR
jgi:hypothetical protein